MTKKVPTISIAMTTYNGEKFIEQQLDSIFMQSFHDFELIICDDCSRDATIKIIMNYQKIYPNITLLKNKTQLGSVKNFEQAIMLCKGKYIALADQDDIWLEHKLQQSIKYMKILERDYVNMPLMVHSDLSMIDEHNIPVNPSYFKFRNYRLTKEKNLAYILGPSSVMDNTILMNQVLKNNILPFPNSLAVHDYWIALINELYGKRITIHQPLIKYRIHQKNLSNSTKNLKATLRTKIQKSFTLDFPLPFIEIGRSHVLHYLLNHYTVEKDDKILILHFITYLNRRKNPIVSFYNLTHNGFVKKGFWYRYELFIKLLFTRRYR